MTLNDLTKAEKCSRIAKAVRSAFEQLKREDLLPNDMKDFPKGCCGYASVVLSKILELYDIKGVTYELAIVEGAFHGWLEVNEQVIDITGDQFSGRPEVYVGKKTGIYELQSDSAAELSQELTEDEKRVFEKLLEKLRLSE
ncbi:hypothetical protein [Hydrocarboniclastica marina]|uniref:Uncharacterized protein n=1 Tax=Hydrocarboniclastica marina TaxID=2259620 RepID=A0A4V1D9A8_9ALTE|nr:hypothetical protein [Hydrocarboniclastica marina]QCF28040.1 hypothetical protein soil367_18375 [Hydrocarboniclastica marina]